MLRIRWSTCSGFTGRHAPDYAIRFRQHQPGRIPEEIEYRQLVLSEVNKNAKIEVGGARILVHEYPTGVDKPILVFKKIEPDLYEYMLVMPGEAGYLELSTFLNSLPLGRSLASCTLKYYELKYIWAGYPN
jgi:hypothetical protein